MLDILLAAFPILLILGLMMGLHWGGAKAGVFGWLAALLIAALQFGAGSKVLLWSQIQAFFLAFYVLYIIWGALLFYRVTDATGAVKAMSTLLRHLSPAQAFQAIILAWGFASFLQSVGGFGVPVAVVAPILVGLGFSPLEAMVMPSIGHAWAISFGSLGSSFYALMASTNLDGANLGPWMAASLGIVCVLSGPIVLWVAGGKRALRENLLPVLLMALVMSGIQLISVISGLWNISAMLASIGGLALASIWAILKWRNPSKEEKHLANSSSFKALVPYLLLLIIIFATKFSLPLNTLLNTLQIKAQIPELVTTRGWTVPANPARSIAIFGHPGALLIYASLLTLLIAWRQNSLPAGSGKQIIQGMLKSGVKSTLGILAMVAMATTMDNAGMIAPLSHAMANAAGDLFPLVSPFIGALGAFMTGSNTNSNVLFGALQRDAALTLKYSVPIILAGHNAGAAVGSVFAPAKVIVGCSTVGLSGKEGEALQRITRYSLLIIVVIALLTWAFA